MSSGDVVGVDGCRGGWVAARLSLQAMRFTLRVHKRFAALLEENADVSRIAVDIPIALSECFAARQCDVEARRLLGVRRSSVFPAPDRHLLNFDKYSAANALSKERCGKGISQQSFHLFAKIAEVDACMSVQLQQRVFEVHPELAFQHAVGRGLQHGKKTPEGFEERRQILRRAFPGASIAERAEIRAMAADARASEVQPDDILDAMIAAWAALRHLRREHRSVPEIAEYDPRGLRMEIVY